MFIAALVTIAKTWKQPKCPLRVNGLRCGIYIYINGILFGHKKNEVVPFAASWMDLEIIILSKVSERERQIPYITYI